MNVFSSSNAGKLARRYQKRAAGLSRGVRKGLLNAAIAVDNKQVEFLSGGSSPGDYPIPVRSGNLLVSHYFTMRSNTLAIIGNTASYALAVHEGKGSSAQFGARRFLDDAVEATDVSGIVQADARKAIFAI